MSWRVLFAYIVPFRPGQARRRQTARDTIQADVQCACAWRCRHRLRGLILFQRYFGRAAFENRLSLQARPEGKTLWAVRLNRQDHAAVRRCAQNGCCQSLSGLVTLSRSRVRCPCKLPQVCRAVLCTTAPRCMQYSTETWKVVIRLMR